MQTLPIQPLTQHPQAVVRVPGSKSLTNRALLLQCWRKATRLTNALFSDDSYYFAGALQQLGFSVDMQPDRLQMRVTGLGGRIPARQANLYIGNAGTAARFLTALLTLGSGEFSLDGDARMRQRPIGDLLGALNELGARVVPLNERANTSPPAASVRQRSRRRYHTFPAGRAAST
jgi:3-phosphoshikimate 1-carboxyvinyltransferase